MNRPIGPICRKVEQDQSGAVGVLVGIFLLVLIGFGGIVVDLGYLFYAHRALQTATDMAALAGAQDINVGSGGTATATATAYSAVAGQKNANSNITAAMASGYPLLRCLTSTGISCSGPDSANAIVVQEQADVPLFFARVLGFNSWQITATATAGARGGQVLPLDVMVILDTTASMNNADTSCSISGATRLDCALAGVRTLLSGLWPCAQNLSNCGAVTSGNVANPVDEVGLMVFPGVTNASQLAYEYDCSSSAPAIATYAASPVYQIVPLSSEYRSSDTAALNTGSNLVKAARGGASGCAQGLAAVGGMGTYYADAITAAQTTLTTSGRADTQKVIILLSDGDANANSSKMPAGKTTNQCHEAITAAQAATAAGTWVYSVAYGASTSGSCSTDSPAISACSTMQQIASDSSKFFSDTTGGTSSCTSAAHSISDLNQIFQYIGIDASRPRLLPDNTT
jgi:Flp pilus assembly protein TadG